MSIEPVEDQTPIAILFARDPLKHTDQDIDRIIEKMRADRHTFNNSPKPAAGAAAPKLTAKEKAAVDGVGSKLKLDLGDL